MTDAAIPLLSSVSGAGGANLPRTAVTGREQRLIRSSGLQPGGGADMAWHRSFSVLVARSDGGARDGAAHAPSSRSSAREMAGDRPDASGQARDDGMDPARAAVLLPMLLQPAPMPSEPQTAPAKMAAQALDRADRRTADGERFAAGAAVDAIVGANTPLPIETAAGPTELPPSGTDAMALAGSVAPNGEIDTLADSKGESAAVSRPDAPMAAARAPFVLTDGPKILATRSEPPSAGSERSAAPGPQADPGLTTGPTPVLPIAAAGNAAQGAAAMAMRRAPGMATSGIGVGIETLSSAVGTRALRATPTPGAAAGFTDDAVNNASTNVPFSFRTISGAGWQSGEGGAGDLRVASMPVAPSRPAGETMESQSFADVVIGMTDGARLEVELAAADSTAAQRLRDELGQLEQELWENGSDVEAIRVELRDAPVAYDREWPQPGDAVSGPDQEDWRRDEGVPGNDRQEQGGSSNTMDGRGMAGQRDASDARPGRWPNDATSPGVGPASQARGTSMPGDGASKHNADGKVDRYG